MENKSKITDFKRTLTKPLIKATLVFFFKENKILLAMKKRGFAQGKWNGIGGKVNKGESILSAAIRETEEEIMVTPLSLDRVAKLNFFHISEDFSGMSVYVYFCKKWKGTPKETEEMAPKWFPIKKIPYNNMWEDDLIWLPQILDNKKIQANILFGKNKKIKEFEIYFTHNE